MPFGTTMRTFFPFDVGKALVVVTVPVREFAVLPSSDLMPTVSVRVISRFAFALPTSGFASGTKEANNDHKGFPHRVDYSS